MSDFDTAQDLINQGPNTYDLDDKTKALLDEQDSRLKAPSTEALLKGVGAPGEGLLTPKQSYNYSAALGGDTGRSNERVIDAIALRNQKRSADYINSMKRELALNEPVTDAGRLRMAGQNIASRAEVALNNNKILKQYDLDKRRLELYRQQQKDGILASILGVIGTIGGVALGVATGGAAAPLVGAGLASAGGKAASEFGKNISFGSQPLGK